MADGIRVPDKGALSTADKFLGVDSTGTTGLLPLAVLPNLLGLNRNMRVTRASVAALETDTSISQDAGAADYVADGDLVQAGDQLVRVDSTATSDFIQNAAGTPVKFVAVETLGTNITAFGAAVDGSTDDGAKLQSMVDAHGLARLPRGTTYLNSEITGEGDTYSWNGIQGIGHQSVLKLGVNARIKLQNLNPGGALGTDHGLCTSLRDFAIDGDETAPYGVIVGTNPDDGEASVTLTANYQQFENVSIMDVDGPAWACGYLTANLWTKCYTKDCNYGWRFITNSSDSACDVWNLNSCDIRSHNIAGLVAYSSSPNTVTGSGTGCFITENQGWGFFFVNTANGFDSYTLINAHFEKNGTWTSRSSASSVVTVPEYGGAMESGAGYIYGCNVLLIGCINVGNFFRIEGGGVLTIQNGAMQRGNDGDSSTLQQIFKDCSADSVIRLEGLVTFLNPFVSTISTIEYNGAVEILGTQNDTAFICGRAPKPVLYGQRNIAYDPEFRRSTGGFTASASSPPTVSLDATDSVTGAQSMQVAYAASVPNATGDSNVLRWDSQIGNLAESDYLAICFYIKSDADVGMRMNVLTNEYGNDMGTARIELSAGEWTRVSVLYRAQPGAATGNSLVLYPSDDSAPTVNIDCFDAAQGSSFEDVAHILRGTIGAGRGPIYGSVSWGPPAIADGAQASTTLTVTGASAGDYSVTVIPPTSTLGLQPFGYISAADTVTIALSNNTGGSLDLGTGTWRVRLDPI